MFEKDRDRPQETCFGRIVRRRCAPAVVVEAASGPINVIGAGSYLPELWGETYATADIIAYDGEPMVKAGRDFLLRQRGNGSLFA